MMTSPTAAIARYLSEVATLYRSGNAGEHRYRPALKRLFEHITTGLDVTSEPKHIAWGAPDFIVTKSGAPLGYVAAKALSVSLDHKSAKDRFDRYRQGLNNLIITNHLTFRLFVDGALAASATVARETKGGITPDNTGFPAFLELVDRFTKYSGATISNAEQLAKAAAEKAKLLAGIIKTALTDKAGDNTLSEQYAGFKKIFTHSVTVSEFADMYAQTLAQGFFAARLNQRDNRRFTRRIAARLIPRSNPFSRKFFNGIPAITDSRIIWIVDALAGLFNSAAVEDIRQAFGNIDQDPHIHFYETFLAAYDPELRETRGVYYTPAPVVTFIVQGVDDILKREFGLEKGIADCSKIKRALTGKDGKQETLVSQEAHKVQILDPAAGTGTFLAAVIDKIYSYFSTDKGAWLEYCDTHLIPRITGFEILMAPYGMAHFKLDMKLRETGSVFKDAGRLRVYLANSLEAPPKEAPELFMETWLSTEADKENGVKPEAPIMVVLGNPPYSGESANRTAAAFLAPYKKEPGGVDKLREKNVKWLNDDYVKFIRYGQNLIEKHGEGVLAYINNHSFLDNPTFRGMRWSLLHTFDKIYILDLHGNAKKKETAPDRRKDGNVFDIQVGVSVNFFIKTGAKKDGYLADVFHYEVYGGREEKYAFLRENTLATIGWKKLPLEEPQYFFTKKDFSHKHRYYKGFGVQDLFPAHGAGVTSAHDAFVILEDTRTLLARFEAFKKSPGREKYLHETFSVKYKNGWNILKGWHAIQKTEDLSSYIKPIQYRPLDSRSIFYADSLVWRTANTIMRHFIMGENTGLVFKRGFTENAAPVFVTNKMIDFRSWSRPGMQGGDYAAPLYCYHFDGFDAFKGRVPNLKDAIVSVFAEKTGLSFTAEKLDNENTFAPIDLLDYIYAVLYSTNYRATYKEFLKIDFPRVPYPESAEKFQRLAGLGSLLRGLHVLENTGHATDAADFPIPGTNEVDAVTYQDEKVYINKAQYFENVPLAAWEYYIGGYRPAQKWLKDRKGRCLTFDDRGHYQKIITVLKTTIELQARIDKEIGP